MRLLIVAAPMVSRGGVYSWLHEAAPILRGEGIELGLLWSARVEAAAPAADWARRVEGGGGQLARLRGLERELGRARREFRPDHVLSVLPQSDLACARALHGERWTAMAHGAPYPAAGEASAPRRLLWRTAVRWAYRRADRVLAVSAALAESLRHELGIADVGVIHNGVRVAPEAGLEPRPGRRVSFLGRLSIEKAPDLFVAAVAGLPCEAQVFGDGPLAGSLRAAAADAGNIALAGWTERDAALERTDLLVVCSRREAFGLSCVEAGAQGIPVLARDVGGIGEIFAASELLRRHCLLPAGAEAAELRERISALLDDPPLRARLGRELHATVSERFALPGQVQTLARALADGGA